ncbi:UDP-3-O-(3-hydroxymyristoyl)glucosamine N-acyltransferase [Colwellia sp. 6M3]|mgnify:FL=1|jgi:UDP-3-O-[3-hydroxymyristoyl] glucosamine N-acyltransferase|uniref:UDP-3-O-(3-hydroxymyristoyl)glucosamine N-acyltransferase n=1 Tax=Colwellia sp. 6M3 TaxID=2759849 RepID=UPI0015F45E95|nr:UDP-3-O-(3-hydroxymyristoyl)glucosamine N-acyltransferase [Colwellia sp. 6M3]MBA6415294.1 UDP-3-O-(3-hydroxymyristoyl)glucosamine N-acyltransferase [Colwellia sp. 6M3]|tara:strand:+ start:3274 stop:4296 length:1023 start_codon:yes stop_codon:yes gene_type:complete
MSYILADIAEKIGAVVQGDGQCKILSIATLASATSGQIAFLANSKYSEQLATTNASAVIVTPAEAKKCQSNALIMDNPYMGYALVAQLLDTTPKPANCIHPSAVIDDSAIIGDNVTIGANAVIEAGVSLCEGVSIGAGSFIGIGATIGANSTIWSNVSIYHGVVIGKQCAVHANTVIGSDGFGYANNKGIWVKIPQLGTVVIGDNVEIGASTTIDRGALGNTIIKDGVILDNQIQIAHNVVIGENTAMAACSVIAGSTEIGKNCVIAGLVGINGHINIADGCVFTGMTMVTKSLNAPGVYSSGMPCQPNKEWHKNNARIRKLESLTKRLSILEKSSKLTS